VADPAPPPLRAVPDVSVVTGAAGWLGQALVHRLVDDGESRRPGDLVRALVLDVAEAAAVAAIGDKVEVVVGDVRDPDTLDTLFSGLEGRTFDVLHTAGVIHPRQWSDFDAVNDRGTRHVLDAAGNAGVRRVVHVSSNSPFGTNPHADDVFRNEETYEPYYGYGESKMRGELHVFDAVERGLDAVIVRPPWFYGPFQPARQTTFFTMIRKGRFPIVGDGEQRRSMVYVDNLVDGMLLAELRDVAPGGAWWIADARPYTLNEIVVTVGDALRDEGYEVVPNRVRFPRIAGRVAEAVDGLLQRGKRYHQGIHVLGELDKTIAVSVDAARRDLGYVPAVSLYDGMCTSIRWCREQGIQL
jgi:nucleoside-diphosphate-sugar epimerase